VTKVLSKVLWYVKAVMGETAYDQYLAHRRRRHPGKPVLTLREFEQARTKPNVRCC
jgi:uncharacterized short protein YbdD (DUF466 family)